MFDRVADALMTRLLHEEACAGVHIVYALAMLRRADDSCGCLSAQVRDRVTTRLRECVSAAVASQAEGGSWTLQWDDPGAMPPAFLDTPSVRFLVTGHLLECLEHIPPDIEMPVSVLRNAATWLCAELRAMAPPVRNDMACPVTHALCAIRNLCVPDAPNDGGGGGSAP